MRQLFEDPRRLEHSELIVVQAPEYRKQRWSDITEEILPYHPLRRIPIKCYSQFSGVLGNVIGYFGEFLVGAIDRGALAAALLGASQVSEAVTS